MRARCGAASAASSSGLRAVSGTRTSRHSMTRADAGQDAAHAVQRAVVVAEEVRARDGRRGIEDATRHERGGPRRLPSQSRGGVVVVVVFLSSWSGGGSWLGVGHRMPADDDVLTSRTPKTVRVLRGEDASHLVVKGS